MRLITLLLILLSGLSAFSQNDLLQGLYFSSHEVNQDKRTSLDLTPTAPAEFPEGFSLEMDANFRRGDGYYGYIFRIIGDGNTNIDLVSNLAATSSNFWLVLKDEVLCSFKWDDIPNGGFDRWIKIKFEIDTKNSKLAISFNGKKQISQITRISALKNYKMIFGACRNSLFFNTDVSPMSLKEIRISDAKGKPVRNWKLLKHSQTKVYDELGHIAANVENPIWYIDRYVKWRKLNEFKFNNIQGIARDEGSGRVFFVDKHAVYVFDNRTLALDTIPFKGGSPFFTSGSQVIYNKFTDELWSYDFDNNQLCKFNFYSQKWSSTESDTKEPNFWQHNKFISTVDSSLVTLFGYGFYTYKSVIHRYNPKSKSWELKDRSDQIEPRYLSSAGSLNNKEMLVFGGYGSKSGHQELSPETYYDLYSLNLLDYSFKKLWKLGQPATSFVPCESLVADQEAGVFYTLLYNRGNFATFMRLAKFGIEKGEFELFNDSIPYSFLDTKSSNDLFLDHKTSQLIALTCHNSDIAVYSLSYPPLMQQDVYQDEPVKGKWYVWALAVLGAGALIFVYFFLFRKKSNAAKKEGSFDHVLHPHITPIEPLERRTISSIYILGEFQIFDHNGTNIASTLSPMLKQLFLYIFLNTTKNSRGVASTRLDEVLWNDKFGESARNNRNVNISKLRTILEKVEGFEFANENSFWKIKAVEPLWCDYTRILSLLRKSRTGALAEPEINELISLLSAGEFLPEIQTDWIDGLRIQFVNETVDCLSSLFNEKIVKANFSLSYNLAECILSCDHLNEEAMAMKCSVLYNLGKKTIAKNFYDSFCREYKQEFGTDYSGTFNTIVR